MISLEAKVDITIRSLLFGKTHLDGSRSDAPDGGQWEAGREGEAGDGGHPGDSLDWEQVWKSGDIREHQSQPIDQINTRSEAQLGRHS